MKLLILISSLLLVSAITNSTQQIDFPRLAGPRLGQPPPGMTPENIAPGMVSRWEDEATPVLSPDGRSLFFISLRPQTENGSPFESQNFWVMEKSGNEWRNPRVLPPPVNSDSRELGGFLSKGGSPMPEK